MAQLGLEGPLHLPDPQDQQDLSILEGLVDQRGLGDLESHLHQ